MNEYSSKTNNKGSMVKEDFPKVFTEGQWNIRLSRGHGFIEGKRDGVYIYDDEGKRYLDCDSGGGMYNLGRCNSEVRAALKKAAKETDQGNFVMLSCEKAELGERLAGFIPGDLPGVYFSVSRGEAVDATCKIARGSSGRKEIVTVDGGSYGQNGFALSLSERRDIGLYGTLIPEIKKIPFGNMHALEESITKKTSAFFIEPIQAENNCRTAPVEYFRYARELCTKAGAYLVFDETQTGMGRTGKKFAFEHYGITPDMLIIGEALGAGYFPITATVYIEKAQRLFNEHPLIHLSTFGGHDVGCRVASASLDEYDALRPWENAHQMGILIKDRLTSLMKEHPKKLRGVAGKGLLMSLNMESEESALAMCRALSTHGVLAMPGSVARNSVVLRPSLTISKAECVLLVEAVSSALQTL